jgi:hypothetical protein
MQEEGMMRVDTVELRAMAVALLHDHWMPLTAQRMNGAADEIDTLRARVRELEGIVSRHGRQGEAALDAVCAMDAEASHG